MPKTRTAITALFLFALCAVKLFGQQGATSAPHASPLSNGPCLVVTMDHPVDTVIQAGLPLTFTAHICRANLSERLTFNWSVSAGEITDGQGTPIIKVDTVDLGGQTLTASV